MDDTLVIANLKALCRVGVTEEERADHQTLRMDVRLSLDTRRAAATDDLREAVDYARVSEAIRDRLLSRPFVLIETVADTITDLLLHDYPVTSVTVRVKKRALAHAAYVAVEITRPLQPASTPAVEASPARADGQ